MKIVLKPLSEIKPYAQNPRVNDGAVAAVVASIKEFGFRQPIVVDADGVIVVGHTRYKAAVQLGLSEVPVHVARDIQVLHRLPTCTSRLWWQHVGGQHACLKCHRPTHVAVIAATNYIGAIPIVDWRDCGSAGLTT